MDILFCDKDLLRKEHSCLLYDRTLETEVIGCFYFQKCVLLFKLTFITFLRDDSLNYYFNCILYKQLS